MGRPLKTGLTFFSVDVDMDEDDKIIDLLEAIGTNTGMGALWQLLNAIYKQGYFMEWNDSVLKKLCRKKHLDRSEMITAVNHLTGIELSYSERKENPTFFDYKLFKEYNILTSKGIQKRYVIACSRREKIIFDRRFILLDYKKATYPYRQRFNGKYTNVDRDGLWIELDSKQYPLEFVTNGVICDNTNEDNVDTNPENVNTSTQRERKEKEKVNRNRKYNVRTSFEPVPSGLSADDFQSDKKKLEKTEYVEIAKLLYSLHKQEDNQYTVSDYQLNTWAKSIRLLIEKDGRNIEDVKKIIRWVKEPDNFWFPNIMSGDKLRKKYPTLIAQYNNRNTKGPGLKSLSGGKIDYSEGWDVIEKNHKKVDYTEGSEGWGTVVYGG